MFEIGFLLLLGFLLWIIVLIIPAVLAFVLLCKILSGGWGPATRLGLWFIFLGLALFGIPRLFTGSGMEVIIALILLSFIFIFIGIIALLVAVRERESYTIREGFLTTGLGLFLIMISTIAHIISYFLYTPVMAEFYSSVDYYLGIVFLIGMLGVVSNRGEVGGKHQTYAGIAGVVFLINFLIRWYGPILLGLVAVGAVSRGIAAEAAMGTLFTYGMILIVCIGILSLLWQAFLVLGLQARTGKIILGTGFGCGLASVIGAVGILHAVIGKCLAEPKTDFLQAFRENPWTNTTLTLSTISGVLFCIAYVIAWLRYVHGLELKPSREEYKLPGIIPEPKLEKPTKKIRCKACSTEFEVTFTEKTVKIKCPGCGSKGKIKLD
ncbi:MAG: hypothetical protein AB1485_02590 [Candidatus Thermoplasmatota archaeon]